MPIKITVSYLLRIHYGRIQKEVPMSFPSFEVRTLDILVGPKLIS